MMRVGAPSHPSASTIMGAITMGSVPPPSAPPLPETASVRGGWESMRMTTSLRSKWLAFIRRNWQSWPEYDCPIPWMTRGYPVSTIRGKADPVSILSVRTGVKVCVTIFLSPQLVVPSPLWGFLVGTRGHTHGKSEKLIDSNFATF